MFVGLPLCECSRAVNHTIPLTIRIRLSGRDPGYLDLSTDLAEHAAKAEAIISLFPPFVKPYVIIEYMSSVVTNIYVGSPVN